MTRIKEALLKLHEDEDGMNTVESILLLVIALVVVAGLWKFVKYRMEKFSEAAEKLDETADFTGPGA